MACPRPRPLPPLLQPLLYLRRNPRSILPPIPPPPSLVIDRALLRLHLRSVLTMRSDRDSRRSNGDPMARHRIDGVAALVLARRAIATTRRPPRATIVIETTAIDLAVTATAVVDLAAALALDLDRATDLATVTIDPGIEIITRTDTEDTRSRCLAPLPTEPTCSSMGINGQRGDGGPLLLLRSCDRRLCSCLCFRVCVRCGVSRVPVPVMDPTTTK